MFKHTKEMAYIDYYTITWDSNIESYSVEFEDSTIILPKSLIIGILSGEETGEVDIYKDDLIFSGLNYISFKCNVTQDTLELTVLAGTVKVTVKFDDYDFKFELLKAARNQKLNEMK